MDWELKPKTDKRLLNYSAKMNVNFMMSCKTHTSKCLPIIQKVFETKIPENVKLKESQEAAKSIYDFAHDSPAAKAYLAFTNELMEKLSYVRN